MRARLLLMLLLGACTPSPPPVRPVSVFGLTFQLSERWKFTTSSPDPRVDVINFRHSENDDILSCTLSIYKMPLTTEAVLAGAKRDMGPTDEKPFVLPTKLGVCQGISFTALPPSKPIVAAVKPSVTMCTMEVGERRLLMMSMIAKSPGSTPAMQLEAAVGCTSLLISARNTAGP